MPRKKFPVVHTVEMIAGKDQQRIDMPIAQVRQHLPHGVRCSLKPIGVVLGLFSGEHLDKASRETRKSIRPRNVPIERGRVELRQNKDLRDLRVDAIRHRHVDETICSPKRHRRFRTLARQREKPRTGTAAQNNRNYIVVLAHGTNCKMESGKWTMEIDNGQWKM